MRFDSHQHVVPAAAGRSPVWGDVPRPLRVSLLDGSELVTTGFATMLAPHGHRAQVLRQPSTGACAPCDLLLVDFALMPPALVEDLLARARTADQVVSYSWSSRPPSGPWWSVAEGRVSAHLTKSLAATDLLDRLEAIHRGAHGAPDLRGARTEHPIVPNRGRAGVHLTPREHDIVSRIAGGMSNAEIAEQLFLSINSVKTYVRTAYRKMGVATRSQAVAWWFAGDPGDAPSTQMRASS